MVRTPDGPRTDEPLVPFADHRRAGDRRRLERQRDWMIVSTDGGKAFSEPMLISESCNGAGGWSSIVAGHTGTYQLRIATIKVKPLPS